MKFFVIDRVVKQNHASETVSPTSLYIILASHNLVHGIDDFLSLSFAQTELLLVRLQEMLEKTQGSLPSLK